MPHGFSFIRNQTYWCYLNAHVSLIHCSVDLHFLFRSVEKLLYMPMHKTTMSIWVYCISHVNSSILYFIFASCRFESILILIGKNCEGYQCFLKCFRARHQGILFVFWWYWIYWDEKVISHFLRVFKHRFFFFYKLF